MGAFNRRRWFRRVTTDQRIASLDSLMRRVQERSVSGGQSLDQAAGAVVEDLERASTALNTRTAPLVPGCGVLVAAAGILLKGEPSSYGFAEFFLGLAIVFAVGGFTFLTRALFAYAGRRTVGMSATVDDVAFAHESLSRKLANARRGGLLAGIGLAFLILGILFGVHISLNSG
jgi:hypothetical protein